MMINAASRLLAQSIAETTLQESDGRRMLKVAQAELSKVKLNDLGTKQNITMYHYSKPETHKICLVEEGSVVGILVLSPATLPTKWYVSGSYVAKTHRGSGLGIALYLGAIHQLSHICSDANISHAAVRVWKSLQKYCKVKLWCNHTDAKVDLKFVGDVPYADSKPIESSKLEYVFYV